MKVKNLEKLRDWLLDGAPHAVFDMNIGVFDPALVEEEELEKLAVVERNKAGLGTCGTICCIAGAAAIMAEDGIGKPYTDLSTDIQDDWQRVRDVAIEWLGLPWMDMPVTEFGHILFDPHAAPEQCTPEEAAYAVQNVIDCGDPKWDAIKRARTRNAAA